MDKVTQERIVYMLSQAIAYAEDRGVTFAAIPLGDAKRIMEELK